MQESIMDHILKSVSHHRGSQTNRISQGAQSAHPSSTGHHRKKACFFLLGAILLEVMGTSLLTYSAREGEWLGYLIMGITITASYYLLSCAVKHIPVGIAYAIWEGVGMVALAAIGFFFFEEALSLKKLAGLMLAVIGIVCVSLGERKSE